MIPSEQAERKRFELWYNNHYDMELITGPDDVEAAWEIWRAATENNPVHPVGYVSLTSEGEPTKFRTGSFGSGHPVYLSPAAATPQPAQQGSVPEGWSLTHIDDPATDGYLVKGPGISYCAWKDKEPWLYLFCEALATTPQPEGDGWIGINEKVPPMTGTFLIAVADPDDIGWNTAISWTAFWNGECFEDCDPVDDGQPVTHWRWLPDPPQPPKEGE